MKIKIRRVNDNNLDRYKTALGKYKAVYFKDREDNCYAIIEVESADDIFNLSKELEQDLIVTESGLDIYDEFI